MGWPSKSPFEEGRINGYRNDVPVLGHICGRIGKNKNRSETRGVVEERDQVNKNLQRQPS